MSLKSFHIFFIVVAILFLLGFGIWFFMARPSPHEALNVFGGLLSFSIGGGLILYAVRIRRKLRNISTM